MFSHMMSIQPCLDCHGEGIIKHDICPDCHGSGFVEQTETFTLNAPSENLLTNGAMLYVGQAGSESLDGGPNGKLIFQVVHKLPENISISGLNVIEVVKLKYYDLLLGTDITVTTPYGKKLNIKVPKNCIPGTNLRARGHGFNINGMTGDYYVIPDIDYKVYISDDEQKLLEQIRDLNKK